MLCSDLMCSHKSHSADVDARMHLCDSWTASPHAGLQIISEQTSYFCGGNASRKGSMQFLWRTNGCRLLLAVSGHRLPHKAQPLQLQGSEHGELIR